MSNNKIRTTDENLQHEAGARAQMFERLGEAREQRRMQNQAYALRASREAERKIHQARLAIARSLI